MLLILQAAPLLVLVIVLARGRGGPVAPVAAALVLAVPAAALSLAPGTALVPFLGSEALRGAWLALAPAAITAGGLLFHEAVSATASAGRGEPEQRSHARLFTTVFLLGPFFETVTGFGIGVVFSLASLRRLRVPAPAAAALALFSQVLIPWGALGPGSSSARHWRASTSAPSGPGRRRPVRSGWCCCCRCSGVSRPRLGSAAAGASGQRMR